MSLRGWAASAVDKMFDCMKCNAGEIEKKIEAGASFELWMTNLISGAFGQQSDISGFPEIGYCGFGVKEICADPSARKADLLLINWPNRELAVCEAAIVLPGTQIKWKIKIAQDYDKLSAISRPGVAKLLLVYACSPYEKVVGVPAWDDWFSTIKRSDEHFLPEANWSGTFPISDHGECALKVWVVP